MNRSHGQPREDGFTLIEVVVSLVVIMIVMVSTASFYVVAVRLNHTQGMRQVAVQLALDGMERVRGLKGPALLTGRAQCTASCPTPVAGAAPYLSGVDRWDAAAAGTTSPSLPRPGDAPQQVVLDGVTFQQYWYLGRCWQPRVNALSAGSQVACGADSSQPVALVRAVVAVTWPGQECAQGVCGQVATALFGAAAEDPVFNS